MPSAKESVRKLLDRLPDDCTLEDVLYHLSVLQKIDAGIRDGAAGQVIRHEQAMHWFQNQLVAGRASAK